jgi:hypothetical protein
MRKNNGRLASESRMGFFREQTNVLCLAIVLVWILGLPRIGLCSPPSTDDNILDVKTVQRLKTVDTGEGWVGSGILLVGYERVIVDASRQSSLNDTFVYGDQVDLILYFQTLEPLDPTAYAMVSLPGHREQTLLGDQSGFRHLGAVIKWPVTIPLTPVPTKTQPLPFLNPETYSLMLTVSRARDGITLLHTTVTKYEIAPLLSVTSGTFLCLSGNKDIPAKQKKLAVSDVVFPDGEPTVHPSGSGDILSELFDGVFTDSGNPHWENVRWDVGWGKSKRSIELKMREDTIVSAVAVVVPNAYKNFAVDRVSVVVYGEENSEYRSTRVVRQDDGRPALSAIHVPTKLVKTRSLRIELEQDAGEYIALSEVYVFGR